MEPTTKTEEVKPAPVIEIKLDETRSKLGEGRNRGIGCAFLKKMNDTLYEGVQPISPCKDYLNDVVYVEHKGGSFSACGLNYSKRDIFAEHAFLVMATCHTSYGSIYGAYDKEIELMSKNILHTQKVLNDIEDMLKLKDRTELKEVKSNLIFAKIPLEWVQSTWMISLWSLLYRNAIYATGGNAFEELLKTKMDVMSMPKAIERIKLFAEKGLPKQDMATLGDYGVHSNGIMNYTCQ